MLLGFSIFEWIAIVGAESTGVGTVWLTVRQHIVNGDWNDTLAPTSVPQPCG